MATTTTTTTTTAAAAAAAAAAPKTKIFVGHLPDGCTSQDLETLFAKYGTVKECDVINKYGFVHMSTSEEAEEAIKGLNNYNLMGSCISVEPSKSKLHPEPGAPGRAKGGPMGGPPFFRRGMPPRNGFPSTRGGFGGGFSNGFRRFDAPFGGPAGEPFFDRPLLYNRDRVRPYPPPYDRRSPTMPNMRDDPFPRRPMPPPPPGGADFMRPPMGGPPPMGGREDLYERRPMAERSDFLYSRRSPPPPPGPAMSHRSYWYDEPSGGEW